MKKLLSIFLALCMLVISTVSAPVYAGSAPVTLIVGSAEGAPGDTVSVPFSIKATEAIKTAGLSKIVVDANAIEIKGFTLDSNIDTDIVDDSMTKYSYIKATKTHTVSVKLYEDATFEEPYLIGTLNLKILDNAAGGEYPITFSTTAKNAATQAVESVAGGDCKVVVTGGSVVPPVATKYQVSFKADETVVETRDIEENTAIGTLPSAPAKSGWTFVEWQDEAGNKVTETTEVISNMVIVAIYEEDTPPVDPPSNPPSTPDLPDVPAVLIVGEATGTPGDTVSVPFSIKTKEPIKTAGLSKIEFDSSVLEIKGLTLDSNLDTDLFDDSMTKYSYVKATKTHTVSVKLYEDYTFEDEYLIGTIDFKILNNVENGDYAITFSTTAKNAATQTVESAAGGACKVVVTGGAAALPKYAVNFLDENGNFVGDELLIKEGNKVGTLPTAPTKEGYTFAGWFTADGTEITADTVVNDDIRATAKYEINIYTVKFLNEDGTIYHEYTAEYRSEIVFPADPQKAGHTFKGWNMAGLGIIGPGSKVTEDCEFTAKFVANEYTVKFINGYNNESLGEVKVLHGNTVTFPTVPEREGYDFLCWSTLIGLEVTATTPITCDMDVYTNWKVKEFKVKFMNGTEVVADDVVEYGDTVTLPTAPTKEGSTFKGWFTADGTEITADTAVKADITATAEFEPIKFSVQFVVDPDAEPFAVVDVLWNQAIGDKMPTEAPVKDGYRFIGWFIDGDEITADTVVKTNLTAKAEFEEITTDIEVVDADGKAIETVTVPYGTAIADIAATIDAAITVNVVEDGEVIEADVKYEALDIKDRVESVKIAYSDYSKEVIVKYETKDAYIAVENTDMILLYPDYDGKTNDELAKYVYENAGIVVFDEYGIATAQDYSVAFAKDAKDETLATATVTAKYNDKDLEAKEIKVTLQPLGSSSSSSGTVVRPSTGVVGGGSASKPSTDAPATDDPAADEPATDAPATDDPATDEPAADEPATDVPATDVPAADVPFTDVMANDWALDAIKDLHARGIISGDESNTLRPDAGITREEVSKIVLNVKGIEVDAEATIDAADAANVSDWAKGFVATAIKEGLLKGYEDGTIQSGKVVTRAEFAAILVRAIGATAEFTASTFTDVGDAWYAADVECAKNLGIVTGYEDGSFQGDKPVTRREAFAMAQRVIKLVEALEK